MSPTSAFIDTNLLILLLVGSSDRNQVGKHRRTRNFSSEDYDRLVFLIDSLDRVLVTPNILTETSNLLNNSHDFRLMEQLRLLINQTDEVYIKSKSVANSQIFTRLGLTDSVLLESVSIKSPLITVDFDLYGAAVSKGDGYAFNFTHWQAW
ncbi:MAG: PIN domain-containing protein [Gammaproteobacteria bacterium]|nr:PIN domain-containing protein [Gammaproteobacteria bacterium]